MELNTSYEVSVDMSNLDSSAVFQQHGIKLVPRFVLISFWLSQRSRNQRKNFADNTRQLSLAKNTAHKSSVDAWLQE